MTLVLALDVGTSSVRAIVHGADGSPVGGSEARTRYAESSGLAERPAELDPDELVEAARGAVESARRAAGGPLAAVAASCFWHSLVAVDGRGRPLTRVLTWRDTDAADEADELAALLGARAVHRRTGCPLHPSFWPAKLLRLRRRDPAAFRRARLVSFADYLYGRLVGDERTSLSMASATGLLDRTTRDWDAELLAALGVERAQLPPISDEPVDAGEPWFPALGDGACSNVGAGAVGPGRAALMIGTSGALRVVLEDGDRTPRDGLFLYRLDGSRVVEGGAVSDGGNLHDWLLRTLAQPDATALADEAPDAHGLTFLPLLGGERSPGWDARARGVVAGLTFETTGRDLVQAGLEGVALRFREIADRMPELGEVVATGGALRHNADWTQILADVLERPVAASGVAEASARGAAVVALERLGERPAPAPLGRVFEPRRERAGAYRAARERQRELYARAARGPGTRRGYVSFGLEAGTSDAEEGE